MMPGRRGLMAYIKPLKPKKALRCKLRTLPKPPSHPKLLPHVQEVSWHDRYRHDRAGGVLPHLRLDVLAIPTNLEYRAMRPNSDLVSWRRMTRMAINTAITHIPPTRRRSRFTSSAKISRMWFTAQPRASCARLCKKSSTITSSAGRS